MIKRRTIGVLAREAGVGVETIRFYEREGLLPKPPQPLDGWRTYGDEAVEIVKYIRLAQRIGFSLAEIKELGRRLFGGGDFCRDFRDALEEKLEATETEMRRLAGVRSELKRTLGSCLRKSGKGECPIMARFGRSPAVRRPARSRTTGA